MSTKTPEAMTPERIAEIRQRCDKATPGPWDVLGCKIHSNRTDLACYIVRANGEGVMWAIENKQFAAHARADLPDLLADNARLRLERDDLRASVNTLTHRCREAEEMVARLRDEKTSALKLLALMHPDGEMHEHRVGFLLACQDAKSIWHKFVLDRHELRTENDALRAATGGQSTEIFHKNNCDVYAGGNCDCGAETGGGKT